MFKVTVELNEDVVQSYLDHYGECVGREIKLSDLSKEQLTGILEVLRNEMKNEIEMRCNDHSGFETENYFYGVFGD